MSLASDSHWVELELLLFFQKIHLFGVFMRRGSKQLFSSLSSNWNEPDKKQQSVHQIGLNRMRLPKEQP